MSDIKNTYLVFNFHKKKCWMCGELFKDRYAILIIKPNSCKTTGESPAHLNCFVKNCQDKKFKKEILKKFEKQLFMDEL